MSRSSVTPISNGHAIADAQPLDLFPELRLVGSRPTSTSCTADFTCFIASITSDCRFNDSIRLGNRMCSP